MLARPWRSTLAFVAANPRPAKTVEPPPPPPPPPAPVALLRAFGVGVAATTELSCSRWSDWPLAGTGPFTEPVPIELVATGLLMEPHVMQLKAGGFGLAWKHACPAPGGSDTSRRSLPVTPKAASAAEVEIRYSPSAAAAERSPLGSSMCSPSLFPAAS